MFAILSDHNISKNVMRKVITKLQDLEPITKGGPPRWTETLETAGVLGDDKAGPYTLDQIQLPEQNPWNASIRFAGLDFFEDGRAALCTWDGDVWIVSGLDAGLKTVRWKRFAAGLQQPLGLNPVITSRASSTSPAAIRSRNCTT